MNRQYFNSRNLSSNSEHSLFDSQSVGAAQTVTPLDYDERHSFVDPSGQRFRVIIRKSAGGHLNKTVFALSLLAVAILGCIAGTLLHFSNDEKSVETGSRYTNSADFQNSGLLKPRVAPAKSSFAETGVRFDSTVAQSPVYTQQTKPLDIDYKTEAPKTPAAINDDFEANAEPVTEPSVSDNVAMEIKREMRRSTKETKNVETNSAEIQDLEQVRRDIRNRFERENNQK